VYEDISVRPVTLSWRGKAIPIVMKLSGEQGNSFAAVIRDK